MAYKTKTRTEQILKILNILAWLAFTGFMIEAGSIVVSYIVSIINPMAAQKMYKALNLESLKQFSLMHYTIHVSFMVLLPLLKSLVWFMAIKAISKLNMKNPFKMEVALQLEAISYVLLGTWIIVMLNTAHTEWLIKNTGEKLVNGDSGEFIFAAGLVFIISQVFKRGVEIQRENELTV